jgi:serine/threonine protein kinase
MKSKLIPRVSRSMRIGSSWTRPKRNHRNDVICCCAFSSESSRAIAIKRDIHFNLPSFAALTCSLAVISLWNHLKDESCQAEQQQKQREDQAPRNVMVSRLRSIRGRSLASKYNVDWMTVLGEGAYGSVYPARLAATGEKVALKKISKRYTDTSSFCRETNALLRIYNNGGHPNISGLRDMYEDNDHYYLVMDLVSGGEMFDHLIEFGAYSEADAARLMAEVASALAFLHGVGVTHADLKPENLLLCSKKRVDGTIKIIDFGCAIVQKDEYDDLNSESNDASTTDSPTNGHMDADTSSSKNTQLLTLSSWLQMMKKNQISQQIEKPSSGESTGTTAYWPPERFQKRRKKSHEMKNGLPTVEFDGNILTRPNAAGDMWAVGVILYIMLTGVHPFDLTGVATDAEIAEQIQKDPSPPISQSLTGHLSSSAIDLIQKLMAKNPKDRLTAIEMMEHPWIAGDAASTQVIENSAEKLGRFQELRAIIEAGIFSILIERGSREMALSEYAPKMVYKDDRRSGAYDSHKNSLAPATSVLKRAFEAFDEEGKGYVSSEDLGRVVTETTGQMLSDSEKNEMVNPFDTDTAGSLGLSLSSFSAVIKGFKHKHYPRGHIIFRAGDEGDAMYFINSGKVEIQTRKGQLVHLLRHGDFFGEGSLLEKDATRFSTAKCATPVDLIKIKRSDFEKYTNSSKSARDTLMWRWRSRALADAKALIRLQTNLKPKSLSKGDVVYKEGDVGGGMYFVDEDRGGILDVKHGDVTVHQIRYVGASLILSNVVTIHSFYIFGQVELILNPISYYPMHLKI